MEKLTFKYATMNAGKSIDLIRTLHNYEENGFKTLLLKPKIDTKGGNYIVSRIGVQRKVDVMIDQNDNILELLNGKLGNISAIFVDESQFLTKRQVDQLFIITKAVDIPVICYGLRTNFKLEAFEGSNRLLELAETLEESKTKCKCGAIARYVGRKRNGKFERDGETVVIDGTGEIDYVPLCGKCYLEDVLNEDLDGYAKKLGGR